MPFFRFLYSFFEFLASKFMHLNGSSCLFQTWNRYLELTLPVKFLLFRNHSRKEKYVEIIRTVDFYTCLWYGFWVKSNLPCSACCSLEIGYETTLDSLQKMEYWLLAEELGETETAGTGKSAVKVPSDLESDFLVSFLGDLLICIPFPEFTERIFK